MHSLPHVFCPRSCERDEFKSCSAQICAQAGSLTQTASNRRHAHANYTRRPISSGLRTRRLRTVRFEVPSKPRRVGMRKWRASQVGLLCPRLHTLPEGRAMANYIRFPSDMNLAGQRRDRLIRRLPPMPREVRSGGKRCRCKIAARTAGPAIIFAALHAQAFLGLA